MLRINTQSTEREAVWITLYRDETGFRWWGEGEDKEMRALLDIPEDKPLPAVQVRRSDHPEVEAWADAETKRWKGRGPVPSSVLRKMAEKQAAHAILVDWQRIALDDGPPKPYTPELGLLAIRAHPGLKSVVMEASREVALFREDAIESDAEELGNESGGNASGPRKSKG